MGGGIVAREPFYDAASGLEGTRYNVTMAYAIGDVAALAVVTDKLSGVGLNATVTEVSFLFSVVVDTPPHHTRIPTVCDDRLDGPPTG